MELSWSTFVLEIINFLVLVWILKRFLYKPVLDTIARRRAGIEKSLADAEALNTEAQRLRENYESRLADWDRERHQAREALARELESERARRQAELQTSLDQQHEKARVAEARRQADVLRKNEETALRLGARFATRLLQQASGPDIEARLIDMVIAGLRELTDERIAHLRNSYGSTADNIMVASAFALSEDQRGRLSSAISRVTGPGTPVHFVQDGDLMAGLRITIGAWILGANFQDELKGFTELTDGE